MALELIENCRWKQNNNESVKLYAEFAKVTEKQPEAWELQQTESKGRLYWNCV